MTQHQGAAVVATAVVATAVVEGVCGDSGYNSGGDAEEDGAAAATARKLPFGKGQTSIGLECLYGLARELDVTTVKHAALALANLSNPMVEERRAHKRMVMGSGCTRPLLRLARHADRQVQRTAAVAIAGLALGKMEPKAEPVPRALLMAASGPLPQLRSHVLRCCGSQAIQSRAPSSTRSSRWAPCRPLSR